MADAGPFASVSAVKLETDDIYPNIGEALGFIILYMIAVS